MKAFAFGLAVAFACPGVASAQSSIVDFSKPMTGQAQFVVRADGQPVERGVPVKVEVASPAPAPQPAASEPEQSAAPIIRPAYLKPDAQMASLRSRCGANGEACSSGTSRPVRVNVVVNTKAEEKPKSAPRLRIGRRR